MFLEYYSPFTLNGLVFTQILKVLFVHQKNEIFSDKFNSIYRAHPGSKFFVANTLAKWKKL